MKRELRYFDLLASRMKSLCSSLKIPQGTGKRGRNKIILFVLSCSQMLYHGVRFTCWVNFEEIVPRDSMGCEGWPKAFLLILLSSFRPVHPQF